MVLPINQPVEYNDYIVNRQTRPDEKSAGFW